MRLQPGHYIVGEPGGKHIPLSMHVRRGDEIFLGIQAFTVPSVSLDPLEEAIASLFAR